jgi:hypothetical protein
MLSIMFTQQQCETLHKEFQLACNPQLSRYGKNQAAICQQWLGLHFSHNVNQTLKIRREQHQHTTRISLIDVNLKFRTILQPRTF